MQGYWGASLMKRLKTVGLAGVVIGIASLILSIYLFIREATVISLTRNVVSIALANCSAGSKELLVDWVNELACMWSSSLLVIPTLSLILLLLSVIVLIEGRRVKHNISSRRVQV